MKIYCKECDKYIGDIRDASLMKSIVYICPSCYDTRKQRHYFDNKKDKFKGNADFLTMFNDILNKK